MGCCGNCETGAGPCLDVAAQQAGHAGARVRGTGQVMTFESPRPLGGIARKIGVGQLTVGTVAVAPIAGGGLGAFAGWMLAEMLLGKRNTVAKVVGAAAGAYGGYMAGQASGL